MFFKSVANFLFVFVRDLVLVHELNFLLWFVYKRLQNTFRNAWSLWESINSCSVNAFLCKLYCFVFLMGFARPEVVCF